MPLMVPQRTVLLFVSNLAILSRNETVMLSPASWLVSYLGITAIKVGLLCFVLNCANSSFCVVSYVLCP